MNQDELFLMKYAPGAYKLETPKLRELVRRSVGLGAGQAQPQPAQQQSEVVWRGPGGSTLVKLSNALDGVGQRLDAIAARVDRSQPAQPQPARPVTRSSTSGFDYTYHLGAALPKTGWVRDVNNTSTPNLRAVIRRSMGLD